MVAQFLLLWFLLFSLCFSAFEFPASATYKQKVVDAVGVESIVNAYAFITLALCIYLYLFNGL